MRVLLLLRGAPGAGKTTYIKENGLEPYALSADSIRLMCQSPVLNVSGKMGISQENDKKVWQLLFQILEIRMDRGEFVVIDATNSKTSEMNRYKQLAKDYRYRIYCVDFTNISIEECKRRNLSRPEIKQVPEEVIDNMYSRFSTQKIPSGIGVISPGELDKIWYRPTDLSGYKRIHHIGDIHGCYTVLQEYFKDGIKEDEAYIFCGDYIDRGIENVKVLNFLLSLIQKPNVFFLEGNHERWLRKWAHGEVSKSPEFEKNTKKELEENNFSQKDARIFCSRLGQCCYYTYQGKTVIATHAGLSDLPDNLTLIAAEQMIRGVGKYGEYIDVANSFERNTDKNCFQIFGHRNTLGSPVCVFERCFDLEGGVEHGDNLRIVVLDKEGFHPIEVKNNIYNKSAIDLKPNYTRNNLKIVDLINEMRENKYIVEKKYGNISSFNFTKDAFYHSKWNALTTKARGLFIDVPNAKIVARSYEKFFNLNEQPESSMERLRYTLKFPVTAYVKENGFLGLVSYDDNTDDFFISSKSSPTGDFTNYLKNIFFSTGRNLNSLKEYLKSHNVTLVFECIDVENDPHIIKYDQSKLVLLDVIRNEIEFSKYAYSELEYFKQFGFDIKEKAFILDTWESLCHWIEEVTAPEYKYKMKYIEGFVIEDMEGFMFKLKLWYYKTWKHMRSVANSVLRTGQYPRTSSLNTPLKNKFYGFVKELYLEGVPMQNIITLRELFYEEQKANK